MPPKPKFTREGLAQDPHLSPNAPEGLFGVEEIDPNTRGLTISEISRNAGQIALAEEGRTPPEHTQSPVQQDLGVVIEETGPKKRPYHIRQPKKADEPVPTNPTHGQIDTWTNPPDPVATLAAFKAGQAEQENPQQ